MNKKTTLLSLRLFLVITAFAQNVNAQQIYSNGGVSTGPNSASAVVAPTGYNWSEVQSTAGNTTESNTNFGYGAIFNTANTGNIQLADDFIVPDGESWGVTSVEFILYQTGFTGTTIPIDQLRVQLFSGDPASGGTLVAGDMVTNVLDALNSGEEFAYRTGNSVTPAPGTITGTTRKLWRVRGTIAATLPPGLYWVVYQVHATNDLNVFYPPVTIVGLRGLSGWNAKQNTVVGTTVGWANVLDLGNPATAPDFPQDMPFYINGAVTLGVNENSLNASISLSPNPVRNVISISVPSDAVVSSYEIFDINGKIVKALNATAISEINVGELSVGNYILKLKSDKGIASKKFIKE